MNDTNGSDGRSSARPPRVVICSADVGCGHGRAATALSLAVRAGWPAVRPSVIDALGYAPRWFTLPYRDAYLATARHLPRLVGWFYDCTDLDGVAGHGGIASGLEARAMRGFCASECVGEADVIVCSHFLCARVLSRLRERGALSAKLAVVVTDQHPHAVWRVPHADLYCVASMAASAELQRHGIPAERVVVTGIPIDARFARPMPKDEARSRHNLPSTGGVALITGGGLGLGGLDQALEGFLDEPGDAMAVVVCGRNTKLRDMLQRRFGNRGDRCRILGLSSRMHELMAAADVMVGKPGGLTTSEAAALGLPMVLLRPLPGQEERNADALLSAGAAVLEPDPTAAGRAAARLISKPMELSDLQAAARRFGRRNSAAAAAAAVMALAGQARDTNADTHSNATEEAPEFSHA